MSIIEICGHKRCAKIRSWMTLVRQSRRCWEDAYEWNLDLYSVMHQLCRAMTGRYEHLNLRKFVLENLDVRDIGLTAGYVSFEMRPIEQRHHLLQLCAWLLSDLQPRLTAAWRARAIRYNLLLKDFPDSPDWYRDIVSQFSNWRDRPGAS